MDLAISKVLTLFLFLFGTLLTSLIPVIVYKRGAFHLDSKTSILPSILAFCNSLACGVFLATCFVALFPVVESAYKEFYINAGYPLPSNLSAYAQVTILGGLFLVLFIEQIVHLYKSSGPRRGVVRPHEDAEENNLISDTDEIESANDIHSQAGHSHGHISQHNSLLRMVLLAAALGVDTLFEGMAVGLLEDIDTLVTLVIAIAIHEFCCAVALGINIGQQKLPGMAAIILCVAFSAMMPVGIAIGMGLERINGNTGLLVCAIVQGIATGTFLYVLFIELLPPVFLADRPIFHIVAMFFGCLVMSCIILFTHKHHGNYHSNQLMMNSTTSMP